MKKQAAAQTEQLSIQHGSPSYWLNTDKVELFVTEEGGHLAPVNFKLKHRWVSPYSLAPWQPDEVDPDEAPVLKQLRGDFFCFPMGQSKGIPYGHGDTANRKWELVNRNARELVLRMQTENPEGEVLKKIALVPGQRAVYQEHTISGVQGRYNFGNHAVLQFPEGSECFINTSPFRFGQVKPTEFTDPAIGEYSALKTGATFSDLAQVPLARGGETNIHEFPNREGYEDLLLVSSVPSELAWTAVTMPGYIWFSLKDPSVLPSTVMWFSHGGRHQKPWQGRHRNRVGLEEVCSHFAGGLEASRKETLSESETIATTCKLTRKKATAIRIVQVTHPVTQDFGKVISIEPTGEAEVTVKGSNGGSVTVPVDYSFLKTGTTQ